MAASPVQPSSPSDDTEQARCEAFMLRHDDKMRETEHEPDSTLYFAEVDLASQWVRFMTERGGANLKDDHLAFCDNACQPEG